MDSKSYWRRRAVEYEREWAERCQSEIERELAGYFRESLKEIEDDIAALYGKYMRDNAVSYAEARRLIRGSEFREWRMSLREYLAAAHTSSAILKELNTLAMRSRISRLEKMYSETLRELQKLGERSESAVRDFLTTAYRERYYHGVFDFAQVGKLEIPVSKVEPKSLEKVLAQRWAGGNFSSRIWKNTEKLSKVLKQTITQGLHRGLSIQKMATAVSREMNSSYKNAERLVRTEMNFVQNHAAKESMEAAGLSEYEFIATLDHRTTQRCRSLDGTVHLLEEFDPGTNAPPMHPRCRSTISAMITEGTRVARNKGGRNIRVPADMRYADWKRVYIDRSLSLKDWQNQRERGKIISDEKLRKRNVNWNLTSVSNDGQITSGKALILAASERKTATLGTSEKKTSLTEAKSKTSDSTNNFGVNVRAQVPVDTPITREQILNNTKIPIHINGFGEAHIPTAKLTKYALNPEKNGDKARAFELALGYSLANIEKLVENIIKHINDYEVVKRPKTQYGEPFEITMELEGENKRKARVTTGWIIDSGNGEIRLTSIYVSKRKK